MSEAPRRPRVVYIMGSGRSGTTLLGSILGEYPDAFVAGEVSYLWERGILEPRGCGCGREPRMCPVWGPVIDRLSGGRDPLVLAREQVQRRRAIRLRHTGALLDAGPMPRAAARGGEDRAAARAAYGAVLQQLYEALVEVTGCTTIVDTSKHPADAALLGQLDGVDPTFVHVVRDSRAVAHSWRRRKEGIARRKSILAALDWLVTNRACDAVRRRHAESSMLLRYEDFMGAPRDHVDRIAELGGLALEPTPFQDATTAVLHLNHTVSGNPDRFAPGVTPMKVDDRWRREMPKGTRALVTTLTAPGLRRYGYSLRG